jgi:hypothetical protein
VKFNVKKSKYMVMRSFGCRIVNKCPKFRICSNEIEFVHQFSHLGNILDDTQSDADCILMRRNQLIGQINNVLSIFRNLHKFVQINLLHTFCYSFFWFRYMGS